mmetsp:Transcript_16519/g.28061  ORF Transcript_16519/g.28061 Transcript_16519/m.28061 type:complete len:170 (-) Transcript_16519:52-561(-)
MSLGEISYPKYPYDDRFTDLEIKEFRELFQYMDRRANGSLDTRELAKAMRAAGALISDKDAKILAKKYDDKETGYISFADFQACMAEVQSRPDGDFYIRSAFSVFDKNDDSGSLSIQEMKHVMSRIGDPVPGEELDEFFKFLDNGSGYCSLQDLVELLSPQTSKQLMTK